MRKTLPGKRTEASGDLDIALLEEVLPHLGVVDSLRHAGRVQGPEAVGGIGDLHRESHRLDARDEGPVIAPVAFPAILQSFFRDERQALPQRVEQRRRRGVMILVAGVEACRAAAGRDTTTARARSAPSGDRARAARR